MTCPRAATCVANIEQLKSPPCVQTAHAPPELGAAGEVAERLALLTTHVSARVRQAALQCQLHLMRGRPALRGAVVHKMCLLVHKLPFDMDAQGACTEQALQLVQHWRTCTDREKELVAEEKAALQGSTLDCVQLEGFGLLAVCSPSAKIRALGLRLLDEARALHRCVLPCGKVKTGDGADLAARPGL